MLLLPLNNQSCRGDGEQLAALQLVLNPGAEQDETIRW